jgi:3,4-dihydroxy 2-butanone 4-phosphate synthase/GTP cyclohydrolase II
VEANRQLGFKPDLRDYGLGCQVLLDLGLKRVRLMTNNRAKLVGIEGYGLEVVERIPLKGEPVETNSRYLQTKRDKMGHLLEDRDIFPGGNGGGNHGNGEEARSRREAPVAPTNDTGAD